MQPLIENNGTVRISLHSGGEVLVDLDDLALLSPYRWYRRVARSTAGRTTSSYARTAVIQADGSRRTVYMHRLILGARRGEFVDHKNGNGLDNRRTNIRLATQGQNNANRRNLLKPLSGFRGVSAHPYRSEWEARVKQGRKFVHRSVHASALEAAQAYDKAAREIWGEFAVLNFPEVTHALAD